MMRDHIRAKYEAGMKARGEKLEDQKTFLEFVPTPKSIAGGAVAGM